MMPAPEDGLGWRLHLGWSIGSLGASALINGISFLALFYMSRLLGIPPALAGALLFGAKMYDIVADPVMGIISDRTRSRFGRRRPYLLGGALLSAASFWMLFHPPAGGDALLLGWAGGALLLYATGYTVFGIPYLAMPAEMTGDYHERSRLMAWRVVFVSLGILAGGPLAFALVTSLGRDRGAYGAMSTVLATIIGLAMTASFFGTRGARFTARSHAQSSLAGQWRTALANRPFLVLIASKFAHLLGVAVTNTSLLFLVTIVLGRTEIAATIIGVASTMGVMLSMPAWLSLSRRLGKRNTYIVAVLVYVPVVLAWLSASTGEPDWALALRGVAIGIATGGLTLTAQAMLPDTIENDFRRSGLRREATFAAVYSVAEKMASAIGPLIFGLLLQAAGTAPTGGTAAPDTIRYAVALLPALASAVSALILLGYSLDREHFVRAATVTPPGLRT